MTEAWHEYSHDWSAGWWLSLILLATCVAALVRTRRQVSQAEGMLLAAAALLTLILTRDFVALGLVLLFAGSGLERFVGLMAILPAALACVVLFRVGKHTLVGKSPWIGPAEMPEPRSRPAKQEVCTASAPERLSFVAERRRNGANRTPMPLGPPAWPRCARQSKHQQLLVHRAQLLRANLSWPEQVLWNAIRSGQLGVAFRRQVPLGRYIAERNQENVSARRERAGSH